MVHLLGEPLPADAQTGASGLVAAYGFEEGQGLTVADASGNGNPGTISGAAWNTQGRFGNSLTFNGTTNWVTVNNSTSLNLTTGMTIEAWVKPTATGGWRTIAMKESNAQYYLYASSDANSPSVGVNIGGYKELYGTSPLATNTWTHVAGTYDGAAQRLYVNGVQVSSRAQTGTIPSSSNPLRIGGNSNWGEYFAGQLDELRIYNRALSQTEIQQDMNTPVVQPSAISIDDITVTEGNAGAANATFTVSLSAASGQEVRVDFSTAGGTATAGADYVTSSGQLIFPAGTTSRTVAVKVNGDMLDEPDETFFVNLSAPINATIADSQGAGTITDDDPPPSLSISDSAVTEGSSGSGNANFTVSLSAPSGQEVRVNFTTAAGTAAAGTDYVTTSGLLIFPAGTTSWTVAVKVNGDMLDEPDETFFVNLSAPVNATVADSQGQGTILDDDPVPTISINDVSVAEGNTGTVNATFIISLSAPSGQEVRVNFATTAGTAIPDTDYATTSGQLIFPAGTTSLPIIIKVNGDTLDEPDESFFVNLSAPVNATIADNQGQGAITDDDPAPTISINDVSVAEGNAGTVNATFTVSLSATSGQEVRVNFATLAGTAAAGTDYVTTSGLLIFPAGTTSQTVVVKVNGDILNEPDETFFVNLSMPVNASITDSQGQGTILDDDPVSAITINNVTVTEGNAGTVNATFTVSLSAVSGQEVRVNFATAAGTATAGADFVTSSGQLIIPAGTTSRTVAVKVNGDMLDEPDETFFVNLSAPVNATVADSQGQGTILDDDPVPTISINDVSVAEGNAGTTNAAFTVSLSAASGQEVRVNYATAAGTAAAGTDYVTSAGQLVIPAGTLSMPLTVKVNGDVLDEPVETFLVNLSTPINATIADNQGAGTITDDDPPPSLSISDSAVTEGNSGSGNANFTVSLSAPSGQEVRVDFSTAGGTATAGTDYVTSSGQLIFPAGTTSQTVVVKVNGDILNEPDETFFVNLSMPVNATITDSLGLGTILDDDPAPAISINDVTIIEGNAGAVSATFTVSLSAASGQEVRVNYATAPGTAAAGTDYVTSSGQLIFPAGTTSLPLVIKVNGDTLDEPNETFSVNLTSPINATIADNQGQGTIADDDPVPALSINNASVTEGNAGTVDATFTVSLSAASGQEVRVNFATAAGTASAGADYVTTSGQLIIPAGTTSLPITVKVNGDAAIETDETFFVNLSAPVNATIGDGQGQGTIINDDISASFLNIGNITVTEGNSGAINAVFTVTLLPAASQAVTVDYVTSGGTAIANVDYQTTSSVLRFTAGTTMTQCVVGVIGDRLDEADETFSVILANASGAAIASGQGICTIRDNDPAPALSISDVTVTEGDSGTPRATFNVSLGAASGREIRVDYATRDATARAGQDYNAISGRLIFPAGVMTLSVPVDVCGDTGFEPDEAFFVDLTNPVNASLGRSPGTGMILDNDPAPSRLYVDASASGANNGASWGNAFLSLQDALQVASRTADGVDEIWVARGTYTPAGADGDRDASFRLRDGLAVYGGFAGGETSLAQRQPSVCVTVLSGDLNNNDGSGANDENSYHVVDGSHTDATAILDGFTITAGYANVDTPNHEGAGVLILAGSPTLRNCAIAGNHTGDGHDVDDPQFAQGGAGGGLFSEGGAPTLINCTITSNSTGNGGKILGASYNDGGNGGVGGGICCSQSDITMIGCLVAGNTTGRGYSDADVRRPGKGGSGAGMYLESSTPQLINCRFLDNVTGDGGAGAGTPGGNGGSGGGLYMETSGINGLRFHNNSAWHITGDSSGLRFYSPASGGNVATDNLWYDCQSLGFNQVSHDYNHYSATDFTFEYTEHPGMHDTVTTGDPFVNVASRDFHLARATSHGLALAAPYTTDPDGLARGADGVWDRGAYEFVALPRPAPTPTPVPTPDPGSYHYVRAGASGSGTDWANAYGQLPPTLVRGDTYYIADGTYPGYNITGPLAGTTPIVIKKATVQAHGTNVGWDSRYGDGVATWGAMSVDTSHVIFDGVTGAGRSGHGFEIYSAGGGTDLIDMYGSPEGLVLSHIQMHFSSRDVASGAAIYGAESASNITISNCYIHDIPGCPLLIRNWTGLLFERNWVARNKSTAESHAEGISTHGGGNFTIRNNVWEDIEGTAVIVNLYGATSNWDIYGNVFFETGVAGGLGHGLVSDNFFAETPRIINCVIAGNRTGRGGASSGAAGGSGGHGGGICSISPVSIENCTMIDNTAGPGGTGATPGAAGLGGGLHSASFTTVANSILWGNHAAATGEPAQITGQMEINASCVEGWTGAFGGTLNHGFAPLLADPARRDYHLTLESPCLDAGDNNLVRGDTLDLDHDGNTEEKVPLDLDGNSRFADGVGSGRAVVDMGAFERVGLVSALWIPAVTCSPLETTRTLSVMATRVSNLSALTDLRITYDARVLRLPTITRVRTAALLTGWSVMVEADESTSIGLLRISAAGTAAVTAALPAALLDMEFDVIGQVGDRTDLTMRGGYLQDEAGREIIVELKPGRLEIAPLPGIRTISGRIGYWPDPAAIAVPGATLAIVPPVTAAALTSASTGAYRFRNLPDGLDYTVTPRRPGVSEPYVITAYDATLILKSTVGSTTLNVWQRLAADVSGEGAISSLDAAQILQYTVGQRALPFPAGAVWGFTPARRQYRLLASDQANQDYTGILYGDVDGNWRPVSGGSSPLRSAAPWNALDGARLWISLIRIDPPGRVLVEISGQGLERAIAMTDLRLVWDPAVLGMPSASRVQLGASLADSLAAVAADGPGGTLRVSLARTVPIALPEATVLSVLFDLKRTTRGATSVLDLASGRLEDSDGHEIPLMLTDGMFRLEAPFGTAVRDWRSYD